MVLKWNVPVLLMAVKHACTLRLQHECKLCKQDQRIPVGAQGNTQGWVVARMKLRKLPMESAGWTEAVLLVGMEAIPRCHPTKVSLGWPELAQGGKRTLLYPRLEGQNSLGQKRENIVFHLL